MILRVATLLLCASILAGCATSAPPSCAGWRRLPLPNQPARLVVQEPALASALVGHNRFGQEQGCWK